jgi:prolyl-tRNA editing enzyme YbaK/EbsC (Cys-tRNA(Pro) deacylase)
VAKPPEVEAATGFGPGGVAPFPLPEIDAVLMEPSFFRHAIVWAGAGSEKHMVGISPSELGRLANARPMDVVAAETYDSAKPKES